MELANYFEFFDLPLSFTFDEAILKNKFYENSKKYHPDFYVNLSKEEQEEALRLSSLNNMAYKVLCNPESRLAYTLRLLGVLDENENYQLAQSFLMDMMDINEKIMDLQIEPDNLLKNEVAEEINQLLTAVNQQQNDCFSSFEKTSNEVEKTNILLIIKDLYFKKKYILRIQQKLPTFASS
jgi:molecular chaperone HscB